MIFEIEAKYLRDANGGYDYVAECPNCDGFYQWGNSEPDEVEKCGCGAVLLISREIPDEDDDEYQNSQIHDHS